jgi:hypothetical protein
MVESHGAAIVRTSAVIALALAIMINGASAAQLSDVQGGVQVNDLAVPVNAGLAPGDRVKAISRPLKIVYNNGTAVTVLPGQIAVVQEYDPHSYIVAPPDSSGAGSPEARFSHWRWVRKWFRPLDLLFPWD